VIPEPEDLKSLCRKKRIACGIIALSRCMLAAIEFDDQSSFQANEIDDVTPDGVLPLEFVSVQTAIANLLPEFSLGVRLFVTHVAREFAQPHFLCANFESALCDHDPLTLTLSPDGGEGNYKLLFTIICLISPMALAGLRPLGQALAQFMMVWQR
jgi:hypothetical protein